MRGGLHLVDGGDAEDFLDGGDALLDEPASGQSELETEHFGRLLRDLADDGLSVLLVEHDMSLVMSTCEYLVVLDAGKVIAAGAPTEVRSNPDVMAAYLGRPAVNG